MSLRDIWEWLINANLLVGVAIIVGIIVGIIVATKIFVVLSEFDQKSLKKQKEYAEKLKQQREKSKKE